MHSSKNTSVQVLGLGLQHSWPHLAASCAATARLPTTYLQQVLSELPLPFSIAGRVTTGSRDGKMYAYINGGTDTLRFEYKART